MQTKAINSYQIIPDRTIENDVMKELAKELYNYLPIYKQFKGKVYNENYFVWEIKITKDDIKFLFHTTNAEDVSIVQKNLPRCTIQPSSGSSILNQKHIAARELNLKYHYFMSIDTDGRKNEPIASILDVQKVLKDDDFAIVQYVFSPESHDWHYGCTEAYEQFKNGSMPLPFRIDAKEIAKSGVKTLASFGLGVAELVQEFILEDESKIERTTIKDEDVANILRERPLSSSTISKSRGNAFKAIIRLVGSSISPERKEQILRHLTVSFNTIQKDNSFISKDKNITSKYLDKIQMKKGSLIPNQNILSTDEIAKLMFLPPATTQDNYNMQTIDMRESDVPKILTKGNMPIGTMLKNGIETKCYWESERNITSLPKILVGPMNAGKSEATINFVVGASAQGHGAIVLDFIKECELSKTIEKHIPKEKLVIIDLSNIKNLFSLSYTEVKITDDMDRWEKIKAAGDLSDQVSYLINALNDNNTLQPLTPKMERILNAACMVTFGTGRDKVYDVIIVLQNHKFRKKIIEDAKTKGLYTANDMKIIDLESLDEYDVKGKVVGTKEAKIEGILDRINTLLRNPYLELMLMGDSNENINFVDYMQQGKIVLIRMPEVTFKKKWIKDVLCTYFLSRIWLAAQIRGSQYKPKVCHIITDEIHQVATAAALVAETITESRKFGVSYYFTCQYLKQFRTLLDGIKSAGVSYMLLAGTEKENYFMLKEELGQFTVEELLNMKRFHSFNIIRTSDGDKRFISKLPSPL